ncbi:DUF4197 domain-containing protein [uncultured Mucilaginibacter sp.]|uniref:DUF4197 domain-containing protein n=1 Tax=uncultured Mucilaginibacter sp. TaxID=797541 RepID=UPI0025CCFA06|nr:DUF4197 domain-containing protein [uncultured Mucilaginibacter sp.]
MKTLLLLIPALFFSSAFSGNTQTSNTPAKYQLQLPSTSEIGKGLKDALLQGTSKSTDQLSAVNGFFGNAAIKIVFPPEAKNAEKTLRGLGFNKLCDNVILSLNRAAEDAAKQAKPIFIGAIKKMTLQDVDKILFGPQDAATQYFRQATSAQLVLAFKPVINASLAKVGAAKYYGDAAGEYNKLPFVKRINPDLSDYATQKAIDGLFYQIALEELNIRKNIGARSTPLLQKVFAFADSKKH